MPPAHGDCTYVLFELQSLFEREDGGAEDSAESHVQAAAAARRGRRAPRGSVTIINLARRADRRAWMEGSAASPLREIGVEVHRLPFSHPNPLSLSSTDIPSPSHS